MIKNSICMIGILVTIIAGIIAMKTIGFAIGFGFMAGIICILIGIILREDQE